MVLVVFAALPLSTVHQWQHIMVTPEKGRNQGREILGREDDVFNRECPRTRDTFEFLLTCHRKRAGTLQLDLKK